MVKNPDHTHLVQCSKGVPLIMDETHLATDLLLREEPDDEEEKDEEEHDGDEEDSDEDEGYSE